MKLFTLLITPLLSLSLSALTIGEKPKDVTIEKDNGGLVSNQAPWHSSMLQGKVYVLFYVDPDEKDTNEHYSAALKAKEYSKKGAFGSIAIINLAATWKPNFVIESLLKSKQEEFPNTLYVKDRSKLLVKEWEIADNASNILIFSKDGRLLFYKSGAMSDVDMHESFKIIEENL